MQRILGIHLDITIGVNYELGQVTPESVQKHCLLEVQAFRTRVHLGCSEEERAFAQEVEFSVQIQFGREPRGTQTDRLDDTICYATLCDLIDRTARAHPFQLIEALGREVYAALRRAIQAHDARLRVTVHKLRTPVENLRGGARFTYGDPWGEDRT